MALLGLTCLWLGFWQMERLEEKLALIASVEERIGLDPVSLPPDEEWASFDAAIYDFRPVTLTGTFAPETVLVFTSLSNANGALSGAGYWVVNPLILEEGGTVFVNRGFIPQGAKSLFSGDVTETIIPTDIVTITGIARVSERANAFTPGADSAAKIDYIRSVDRMSQLLERDLDPIAPLYVNQDASDTNDLPQGGETVVNFPNRHFEYAMTWFAFAGVALVMTLAWIWLQRRRS